MCGCADSPCGSSDEDNGEDKPEHIAENDDFHHVQVRPEHIQVRQLNWLTGRGTERLEGLVGLYLHNMKSGIMLTWSCVIGSQISPSFP